MTISYQALLDLDIPAVEQSYTTRDTILYALSVGMGGDPEDEAQLAFVDETRLKVLPTFATVLAYPGSWIRDLVPDVDWTRVVHSAHKMQIHRLPAAQGSVTAKARVVDVVDKGAGKAAIFYLERTVRDRHSGTALATLTHTLFCRGAGGFGSPSTSGPAPRPRPERPADWTCDLPTLAQGALLFRLNGDLNPLHSNPAAARKAGFPRPILHGLATWGVAGHALLKTVADYAPERIRSMEGYFSAAVLPGETLRTEIWRAQDGVSFRLLVPERNAVVFDHGFAEVA